ncbi:MAG TPA: 4Fe-4S ferredoxin [Marinilabiliales bacterium]|nr:MAG: 4Fe-4S ferredoxin [Bacteroidetes bacterium GWA2_40_14]OFX71041.1 MAG: 4Fe-4S ferredoxin [Bacteroidetes bacterium GWD2_40_43]OFX92530.1 MAG: 4Fe-4S ferredoxin [Bacteroidetes bacterium GWE2_40_63]OFY16468.1 MAG: 4Fe-4S ferredoxin [Bacteroidetes bacterium GWF2_40_13]OFZ27208.1 MAG: 4Fe-4S ferredoxin [Bacteroidetes bacterium RIFOXYC2_FULL_40_12]HAM97849.1 4Fe-4S ferredoxin [Marinilabiliales bacterium]
MKREIVKIDRNLCNGCGVCIPNCHEGALQMIDGKATLVSELMCDGLGACIGHCPVGAITIEEREAEAYDEVLTIKEMIKAGRNTVAAHLKHLRDYNEKEYVHQAFDYMKTNAQTIPFDVDELLHEVQQHGKKEPRTNPYLQNLIHKHEEPLACGCPGSAAKSFVPEKVVVSGNADVPSQLSHWPVQMHLINPNASFFQESDLLLSADCVAYALGNFHTKYLKGKKLAIACPKLDSNKEVYIEKLVHLIDQAKVNTITVMKMEVPCCGGLMQLVQTALQQSARKVPVKLLTVSSKGEILEDRWL